MELLIVDSSQSFAEAVQARIGDAFRTRWCGDGEEALRALKESTPDILLLHLALPRKDGLTVLNQMACRPKSILVMANYMDIRLTKRLQDMGVVRVLIQPSVSTVVLWITELASGKYALRPRERFSQKLQSLGFHASMAGYDKILLALELLQKEPKLELKAHIYPYVGTAAEKSIRDAIKSAYRNGDRQAWDQMFPTGRPSNKLFLRQILQADRDREP